MAFRDPKPVRQCCCYPHSFAEILQLAQTNDWHTVEAVGEALGCGTGCGLCRPYMARMLRTGKTAFAVMGKQEAEGEILPDEKK